jgi:hypothetical protein
MNVNCFIHKKIILVSFNARLEIISDVVSEKARSGKIPIPHRFFPISRRFFPIPYRYFRCGIGIFPLRAFPIPHRKLFLTVWNHLKNSEF